MTINNQESPLLIEELYKVFYRRCGLSNYLTDRVTRYMLFEILDLMENNVDMKYLDEVVDMFDEIFGGSYRNKIPNDIKQILDDVVEKYNEYRDNHCVSSN